MYRIGIDLGGTIIKIGLVHQSQVIAFTKMEAGSQNGLAGSLQRIAGTVNQLLLEKGLQKEQVAGIGIAFPGIVDPRQKKVLSTNKKYDDAGSIDLPAWAAEHWQAPLVIDNDARLALVGEWQHGAARGHDDVVMMTIGTGIGTGVVIGGRVLYGAHFQGGSLGGHITIDLHGRACTCGNRGCVEAMASSAFLPAIIASHEGLSDEFRAMGGDMDFRKLFQLAAAGQPDAISVRNACMDVWGAALVTYVHAYDPTIIVLGGGILNSNEVILPYLQEQVKTYAWCPRHEVSLSVAARGDQAALLGIEYQLLLAEKEIANA